MPELPEVQTTVNGLHSKVLNRTFVDVWSDWEKTVRKPKDFKVFKEELKGKKITHYNRLWHNAQAGQVILLSLLVFIVYYTKTDSFFF